MSNPIIHALGDVLVTNRIARVVLVVIAIAATGAGVFALSHGATTVPQAPTENRIGSTATATVTLPMLPTVVVQAQPAIPVLPIVTVRADRVARDVSARRDDRAQPALIVVEHDLRGLAASAASGGGYGMPYYSFGKTMRRANKE